MKISIDTFALEYRWEPRATRSADSLPPVVLCHSLATSLRMWDPQVPALSKRYSVLRFDTRGHGGSSAPPGPYSMEMLADDVHALLGKLGFERVHFVGLSLGGMVGQVLALRHPEHLSSLVLCGASARTPPDAHAVWDERLSLARDEGMEPLVESTIARWFTPTFIETRPDVVDPVRGMIRSTSPIGYVACGEAVRRHDIAGRLNRITAPTLVLAGSADPGLPLAAARQMQVALSGASLAVIDPASHLCNLEQPEQFNETVLAFLAQVDSRA